MVQEDWLFIWVSGNRLFDARIEKVMKLLLWMTCMEELTDCLRKYKRFRYTIPFCRMNDMEKFKSLINENTKLVWVETPTNSMMKLVDIEAIAKITRRIKCFCS
jgi:cystathionine beta-lyase/cystathionine gamma-synthase